MNKTSRKVGILVALALILLLSIMIAVNMGYSSVPLKDVIKAFFGIGIPGKIIIIRQLRLPRILVGALCGIGLALSGSVLQSVTGNALADPVVAQPADLFLLKYTQKLCLYTQIHFPYFI